MGMKSLEINTEDRAFVDVALTFNFLRAHTCIRRWDKHLIAS